MLEDILITEELSRRAATRLEGLSRSPNWQAEAQAMQTLARQMASGSKTLLQSLVETAVELCQAGTAGISLLERTPDGKEVFCWIAIAGTLAQQVSGTTPRDSPCGVCLERVTPQLFSYPERYFTYLEAAKTPIVEALVLPLIADSHELGAIWIMLHDEQRHFDLEDVRVMTSLADFTVTALRLNQRQTQELLAANERNRVVLEAAELATWDWNLTTNRVVWNEQHYRLLGLAPGQGEETADSFTQSVYPEDLHVVSEQLEQAISQCGIYQADFRIVRADNGEIRWMSGYGWVIETQDGRATRMSGVMSDSTERQAALHERNQVEAQLRSAQRRLELSLTGANLGVWTYNISTNEFWADDRAKHMHGHEPHEVHTFAEAGANIHPEDRDHTQAAIAQAILDGSKLQLEYRVIWRDGSVHGIASYAEFFQTGEQNGGMFYGVAQDITDRLRVEGDRKRVEAALRESEARSRALIENLPGGAAFIVDRDLRYLLAEGEALSKAGFKSEDLVGRTIFEVLPPELAASYETLYRQGLAGESFEYEHDAHNRSYISRGTPLLSPNGEVYAVLAVSYDISERKQAEAAIAADLKDAQLLQELSARLVAEADVQMLYDEIMAAAIALMQADAGSLQFLDEATQELVPITTQGSTQMMAEHFHRVGASSNTWWGLFAPTRLQGSERDSECVEFIIDITARKQAEAALRNSEERQAFLLKLSDALRSLDDPHAIQHEAMRMLGEQLGVSRAAYFETDGDEYVIDSDYAQGVPSLAGRYALESFGQEALEKHRKGQPSIVPDIANMHSESEQQSLAAVQVGAYIVVPLAKEGRFIAGLTVHSVTPRAWTPDEVAIVEETAERIWAAVERACAEVALRKSEEKYRSLFNSMDEGVVTFEVMFDESGRVVDERFLETNPAMERLTGLANVVGKTVNETIPNVEPFWHETFERVAKTGESERFEYTLVGLDQNWYDCYCSRVGGEGSRVLVSVFSKTTSRKRREANLAFLAEVSQNLVHLTNVDETMDALGAKIGGHFNVSRCAFVEINEAADEAVCEYDWHRTDVPSLVGIYRIGNFFTDEFQRTLRAGEAFVTRDIYADLRVDAKNLAALNIASFITIPIIRDGQLQFVLCIYDSEARDWRDDEIELMHEITSRIWTRLERAHAEADLRVSEEKYRTLFDSIDEGYCVIEMHIEPGEPLDYRFIATNRAFEKQSTLVNAQGKWMRELRPNHEESWFEIYRDVALTGEPIRFEHGGKELGDRWFTLYAFRIGEPNQRQVAVLFNDITERKQAEQAKTVFVSNVSHEFRTPLTLFLSPLQDALSDRAHPLSPVQQSQLQLAHRNAIRLLKLVNTLLDVSRIEAGRIQAVYEPTDLATLTTELASSFESAIEQAGLQLVIDCSPLPQPVYVDRSMWEKIVLNLLSNAFKFTFAGEITVRLTSASDQVELTVQDTGIGIAAAELPHLFERFYQVKGAKGRSFEGSGIGLSLVQELIKLHGGTIGVSSVEGKGSCFTVSIPTGFAHLPPEQIGSPQTLSSTATGASAYVEKSLGWLPEEAGEQAGAGEQESLISPLPLCPSAPLLRTARILLVDDNADMRTYLKRLLEERWQVETAANGALALTQIQQNPPDLVLTDVMMPEMDGLQLLQALRANPQTRSIPIILLSARAGEEATIEGLETGADDYLIKPFSARELMARLETHLQLALLRQERSANRFKNEFLLTVTHELQSPLTLILGWARLLQSKSFNADTTAQALATIERSATIEAKLIKDLLDVSGLLSGKVQLKSQFVELAPLLQSVTTQFRAAAEAKQIQLIETILNVPQRNIVADGDRLNQILANLLDNAIKFTPEGEQVTVRLECLNSEVHITVADTGIGIPPDFLPYVFDRFTQAEVPSRHSPGGVGIGLAIARLLVELHKGTIKVASEGEGRGATFTVRLPLITSTEAPALEQ